MYTRESLTAQENRLSGFDFLPFDKEQRFRLVETMKLVARSHDASVAQVALAWLLAKRGVSTVLVGATKPSQLEDNLGAVNVRLTADEVQQLDGAAPHSDYYPSWFTSRLRDADLEKALAT
jgi:aryl-alcohol dehydrogenase-like predicted oxidoreductase